MSFTSFWNPKSVAIIGASNKPGKVGYSLARRALRFHGKVYFVNVHGQSIFGKDVYASVAQVKGSIDLAVIAVPAVAVKEVVEECCAKKIRSIIIISAGFAEVKHRVLQDALVRIARAAGARILGPNTFGVVNTKIGLDLTFAKVTPEAGTISCISQSGALWSYIADYSREHHVGFAKFVSLGDMADVTFTDILLALDRDKSTKVILAYIENLPDGREFMRVMRKVRKPVVVLKAGKTIKGKQATVSHTGSLAGSYEVYAAAFRQVCAYHAEELRDALALAKYLSWQPLPAGNRVVVVTNAGGPGILCADALQENGLNVVALPRKLFFNLPSAWSHGNPMDVLGDAREDRYSEVLRKLAQHRGFYDCVVVVLTPQEMSDAEAVAREIVDFSKKTKKPVVCCFMGYRSVRGAREFLEKHHVPCFHDVGDVAATLEYVTKFN